MIHCLIIGLALSIATRTTVHAQSILHTYYDDDDDAEDNLALLQYWRQSWQAVGWETVVLNSSHIMNDDEYTMRIQQRHSSLSKWIAMSTRGGHYCHWDVFPLRRKSHKDQNQEAFFPFHSNSNSTSFPDTLIVYEVIAPTCMSGSMHAWQEMTHALDQHAQQETYFWTDALALVDLRDRVSLQRGVLQLDDSLMFSQRQHDPCHNLQKHIQRKRKWAVQFSPATLQRARHIPNEWRYPQRRLEVARAWFQEYHEQCQELQ